MITIVNLTDLRGERMTVGFPADRPYVLRWIPDNEKSQAHTMITFGMVWARVTETPDEILGQLRGGQDFVASRG